MSNALTEVGLVAGREIRKNLRSVKGLVMAILSLLGGVATALLLVKIRSMDEAKLPPEQLHALQEQMLARKYDDEAMGKYLADAPPVLLAVLLITVWLGPMLVVLLGFDAIAGDLQHKTVRYWTVRARRVSFYLGKLFGLWAAVAAITLLMHLLVWGVTIAQSSGVSPGAAIGWGVRFYLITLPISAAWAGLALLVNSQFKTPIVALLVTCAVFFAIWLVDVVGEVGGAGFHFLVYAYPNTYDGWLLSPKIDRAALGGLICVGFAAVSTAIGAFFFQKRDL